MSTINEGNLCSIISLFESNPTLFMKMLLVMDQILLNINEMLLVMDITHYGLNIIHYEPNITPIEVILYYDL